MTLRYDDSVRFFTLAMPRTDNIWPTFNKLFLDVYKPLSWEFACQPVVSGQGVILFIAYMDNPELRVRR